jgi:hypothetical protein
VHRIIDSKKPTGILGEAFVDFTDDNLRDMGQRELEKSLINLLLPVQQILNYEFNDKFLLLEAFTHKSFKEYHGLSVQYERLEVLGDAVLDYIANSNLIKYTIFEKYNVKERLA